MAIFFNDSLAPVMDGDTAFVITGFRYSDEELNRVVRTPFCMLYILSNE